MSSGPARESWRDDIDRLKAEGVVDADDENAIIRHLNEQREALQAELAKIVPEYQRRLASDGRESADDWLAARARELGERDGAAARRVTEQMSAVRAG